MEEVGHFDTEQQRFFGEFDVKCVVATIFSNDRKIGFLLERLESRFDAQHILRTVGESGNEILIAQVHIGDLSREDDVRGLVVANFQCVRGDHSVKTDFAGKSVEFVAVGVVCAVHVHVVFGDRFNVRRHVITGVFDIFCIGGYSHTEYGYR